MTKYAKFTKATMAYADSFISWMKRCSIFHGLMMVVTAYTLLTCIAVWGALCGLNGIFAVSDFVICIISSPGQHFMLYSSLECAENYSSLLHVVSVCVDKAMQYWS
ncbi:MAG: hypothetical protein ACLS61_14655 [Ruminococcus sp.]